LLLQYTVKTPKERINSLETNEKEDIYYRLDREIQLLLEHIDRRTGNGNTLYFLFEIKPIHTHQTNLAKTAFLQAILVQTAQWHA
jgi:hypothetical protein